MAFTSTAQFNGYYARSVVPDYVCLSTDIKPGAPTIPAGSRAYELDTGNTYIFNASTWALQLDKGTVDATITVNIANSGSLSGAAYIGDGKLLWLRLPSITSAAITFQTSANGVAYKDFYDSDNNELSIPASTGDRDIAVPLELLGAPYVKVRSGTSASPVTQSGGKDIVLVLA